MSERMGAPVSSTMSALVYDAIVIGAGANGLAAAAYLGRRGMRVLVVEQAGTIGGQSRMHEFAPGFSAAPFAVDAGWLPPFVARAVGLPEIPSVSPDLSFAVATDRGAGISVPRDVVRAADTIRPHSVRDAARWPAFVARLRALSGFLETLYQAPAPAIDASSVGDLASLFGLGRAFRRMGREHMIDLLRLLPMAVRDLVDDTFESDALKVGLAAGAVRDIRQGPRSGGTTFVLLHHMTGSPSGSVRARSWWRDGPDALDKAMRDVILGTTGTIRTGARVARILVRDDEVTGVLLDDAAEVFAPIVISTADPAHTLLNLIDPVWLDPEFIHAVRNIKFRGCTSVVEYAVDRLPDLAGLDIGVTIAPSLDAMGRAYDASKYANVSDVPLVELSAPTLRWPAFAPQGKHVLVARAQYTPYHLRDGSSWDTARAGTLVDAVTNAIARVAPGFAESILHRALLTPVDIEHEFGVTEGAVTHGELTLDQVLFMRPVAGWGRHATPIRGLFLGGAGAHPGPGILGGAGVMAAARAVHGNKGRSQ